MGTECSCEFGGEIGPVHSLPPEEDLEQELKYEEGEKLDEPIVSAPDEDIDGVLDEGVSDANMDDQATTLLQSFEGIRNLPLRQGAVNPPDTVGDVGPHHYVQMVNLRWAVYSKTGKVLVAPRSINSLFQGFDACDEGSGDPSKFLCLSLYSHHGVICSSPVECSLSSSCIVRPVQRQMDSHAIYDSMSRRYFYLL